MRFLSIFDFHDFFVYLSLNDFLSTIAKTIFTFAAILSFLKTLPFTKAIFLNMKKSLASNLKVWPGNVGLKNLALLILYASMSFSSWFGRLYLTSKVAAWPMPSTIKAPGIIGKPLRS